MSEAKKEYRFFFFLHSRRTPVALSNNKMKSAAQKIIFVVSAHEKPVAEVQSIVNMVEPSP